MSTVTNLQTFTAHMDYSYSRHSNLAGGPLPRIPRWPSSSRSVIMATGSTSAPSSPPATIQRVVSADMPVAPPAVLVVEPPTPPRPNSASPAQEEASTSSSGSEDTYVRMNPRTKRVRTPKMQPFRSPAEPTPTPAVHHAKPQSGRGVAFPSSADERSGDDTHASASSSRRGLRIDLDALRIGVPPTSTSFLGAPRVQGSTSRIVSAPHPTAASIARKKSGEPLKSSLKARRPVVRGDLSVVTGGIVPSKSEPNTPSAKSVHFDAQLEHVKLFLAEQKPLAISREGSPTDTSGTESDFPSAIYGTKKDVEEKLLAVRVTNMPSAPRPDVDVRFEDLTLAPDSVSLIGRIRVRNIAFEKWVAVRFTLDDWQTTSEVSAKYLDSVPGGVFDRFSFTIRLSDMLARIEEKTLYFALRYNVADREIWDNNAQRNYAVSFTKAALPRSVSDPSLASLKSKLERVAQGAETVGAFMAHGVRRQAPFTLGAATSLSARYDFAASLKNPWPRPSPPPLSSTTGTPTKPGPASGHTRTSTYPDSCAHNARMRARPFDGAPLARAQTKAQVQAQALSRGSPRIGHPDSPLGRPSPANAASASVWPCNG